MSEASGPDGQARDIEFEVDGRPASARLQLAVAPAPQPLVVLVGERSDPNGGAGSGDTLDDWPTFLTERGSAVLAFDPLAGADGWRTRTFQARAEATLAALAAGRAEPEIAQDRVGLLGLSQDGWVAALAAVQAAGAGRGAAVAAVVTISGSGVTVAEQERFRIDRQLPAEGFSVMETQLARSLLDRRIARLAGGHAPEAVFADERAYSSDRWFRSLAARDADELEFLAGVYAFDPVPLLERVPCPVLGVFGAEDDTVPVFESVKRYLASLRRGEPESQVVIVPGADHELRVSRDGTTERPAAVLETIADWLGLLLSVQRPC